MAEIDCLNNCVCCHAQSPLPPVNFTQIENESRFSMLWKFGSTLPGMKKIINRSLRYFCVTKSLEKEIRVDVFTFMQKRYFDLSAFIGFHVEFQ